MKKCIASTSIYEHVYEHSSDAPIKFLLSVKKHRSNNKTFKNHGQITLTKLLNPKTVIEKLLTIKLRDKGKQLSINSISDQIAKMLRAPKSMLSFFKDLPMLLSDFPTIESEPDFATILEELPGVCDMLSNRIADGNFTVPESTIKFLTL